MSPNKVSQPQPVQNQDLPIEESTSPSVHHGGRKWTWLRAMGDFFCSLFQAISWVFSKTTDLFISNDPEVTKKHGHGVENDANSCYIISTLQALRWCNIPQLLLETEDHPSQNVVQLRKYVTKLCTTMQKRELRDREINYFKRLCFQNGFLGNNDNLAVDELWDDQQDANEFFLFLVDRLQMPQFNITTRTKHGLPKDSVKSVKATSSEKIHTLFLRIHHAKEGSSIQSLIDSNYTKESIGKDSIEQNKLASCPPHIQRAYGPQGGAEGHKKRFSLSLSSAHHLSCDDCPDILPVTLARFTALEDGSAEKVSKPIHTSPTLTLPVDCSHGESNKKARYAWHATVIHSGSADDGHYYMYGNSPAVNEDKGVVLYSDEKVRFYKKKKGDTNPFSSSIAKDCDKNGYIHFYKFQEFV